MISVQLTLCLFLVLRIKLQLLSRERLLRPSTLARVTLTSLRVDNDDDHDMVVRHYPEDRTCGFLWKVEEQRGRAWVGKPPVAIIAIHESV